MTVNLPTDLKKIVAQIIAGGIFQDESEVLREALLLLRQREQLKKDVNAGIEQLEEGKGIPGDQVFERVAAPHLSPSVARRASQSEAANSSVISSDSC